MKEKRGDVNGGVGGLCECCFCFSYKKPKTFGCSLLKCLFYCFKPIMTKYSAQATLQTGTSWVFCNEAGERGRITVNILVLSVKLIWSSLRLFLTEGLFELGKIRHPTCTLF